MKKQGKISAIKDKIIITGADMILQEEAGEGQLRVARRAPLEAVLRYAARVMPPPLPVLPPGARWLCRKKDLFFLVVEHPPQCRTLRVSRGKKGEDDYHPYRLAFPYVIYVLTFYRDGFEEMKMFFRNRPLSAPTDTLYHTNLPNVRGEPGHYGSQRVCLRYRPEMLEGAPLAESVPALLEFFWSTGFNQDIANSAFGRAQARDPRFASLEAWEAASGANPLFPLEVDWEPAGRDLPGLWLECLKLHGETAAPINTAGELADILYRLPVGY
ncbi:MAG: hypothetical protein FJ121_02420 [Deltaproteobacteria bacterium]|nr:hypothetical protein [Deltaproteobacteria bacterium]